MKHYFIQMVSGHKQEITKAEFDAILARMAKGDVTRRALQKRRGLVYTDRIEGYFVVEESEWLKMLETCPSVITLPIEYGEPVGLPMEEPEVEVQEPPVKSEDDNGLSDEELSAPMSSEEFEKIVIASGLTKAEFAGKIGVSPALVGLMISGRNRVTEQTAAKVRTVFKELV